MVYSEQYCVHLKQPNVKPEIRRDICQEMKKNLDPLLWPLGIYAGNFPIIHHDKPRYKCQSTYLKTSDFVNLTRQAQEASSLQGIYKRNNGNSVPLPAKQNPIFLFPSTIHLLT